MNVAYYNVWLFGRIFKNISLFCADFPGVFHCCQGFCNLMVDYLLGRVASHVFTSPCL